MSKATLQHLIDLSPPFATKFRESEASRKQVIDAIVNQQVILQAAYRDGLDKKMPASLSVNEREQQMASLMLRKVSTEYSPVTAKQASTYAKAHASQLVPPDILYGSMMMFGRKENADEAWKALTKGGSFEKLANNVSEDRETAARGGAMYPLPLKPPSEIERAMMPLQLHHFSNVLHIGTRFYIFRKEKVVLSPPLTDKSVLGNAYLTLERAHLYEWIEKTKTSMNPVIQWDLINAMAGAPVTPKE